MHHPNSLAAGLHRERLRALRLCLAVSQGTVCPLPLWILLSALVCGGT
uniref:Uncharacterized protein n=1 Tax=Anguilla anguilla TaxID=7936 RepID=A0A0E9P5K5_ANGAN